MKPNRFIRLFLLLLASSAGMYFFSCQRDTEQPTSSKPFSDNPVVSRTCTDCVCTVTTNVNATLDICGDLTQGGTSCSGGCNSSTDVGGAGAEFVANEPKEFCVEIPGSLCIKNVGSSIVTVTVRFGSSSAIVIAIGVNETQCFHNDDCTSTESHCH